MEILLANHEALRSRISDLENQMVELHLGAAMSNLKAITDKLAELQGIKDNYEIRIAKDETDLGKAHPGGVHGWAKLRKLFRGSVEREALVLQEQLQEDYQRLKDVSSQLSKLKAEHDQADAAVKSLQDKVAQLQEARSSETQIIAEVFEKPAIPTVLDLEEVALARQVSAVEVKLDSLKKEHEKQLCGLQLFKLALESADRAVAHFSNAADAAEAAHALANVSSSSSRERCLAAHDQFNQGTAAVYNAMRNLAAASKSTGGTTPFVPIGYAVQRFGTGDAASFRRSSDGMNQPTGTVPASPRRSISADGKLHQVGEVKQLCNRDEIVSALMCARAMVDDIQAAHDKFNQDISSDIGAEVAKATQELQTRRTMLLSKRRMLLAQALADARALKQKGRLGLRRQHSLQVPAAAKAAAAALSTQPSLHQTLWHDEDDEDYFSTLSHNATSDSSIQALVNWQLRAPSSADLLRPSTNVAADASGAAPSASSGSQTVLPLKSSAAPAASKPQPASPQKGSRADVQGHAELVTKKKTQGASGGQSAKPLSSNTIQAPKQAPLYQSKVSITPLMQVTAR